MKVKACCLLLVILTGAPACSLHRNAHIAPTADVDIDAKVLAKFQREIEEYIELHQSCCTASPQ